VEDGMANSEESVENVIKSIAADLERDTRVDLHQYPIRVDFREQAIVLEGVVGSIAAKRIARNAAHRHAGHRAVLDRLRVAVPLSEGPGHLRDEVVNLLQSEPVFNDCDLTVRDGDALEVIRVGRSDWGEQRIEIAVTDSTVHLSGRVISLSHRRLAEVLAWWAAGCESVENLLHVGPPERETDDELVDAVRLVLARDPLVHAGQLFVRAEKGVVTLEGSVASDEERQLAVLDAWYVCGIQDVADRIQVRG
jgi:osmotically-inducible protein OsmY